MLELIKNIIYEVTGKKGITPDTDFVQDLELNSFDVVNIVAAFEAHFNTRISTRDIWQFRRVQDVLDYLEKKGFDHP
ncbi:MAG: acyl carrier protein [Pseudoflavonifractor sp.]|nr:acyl carrier protein [Pseudoflavonifractor sp.]